MAGPHVLPAVQGGLVAERVEVVPDVPHDVHVHHPRPRQECLHSQQQCSDSILGSDKVLQ